jgi:hypothetical protein
MASVKLGSMPDALKRQGQGHREELCVRASLRGTERLTPCAFSFPSSWSSSLSPLLGLLRLGRWICHDWTSGRVRYLRLMLGASFPLLCVLEVRILRRPFGWLSRLAAAFSSLTRFLLVTFFKLLCVVLPGDSMFSRLLIGYSASRYPPRMLGFTFTILNALFVRNSKLSST